MNIKGILFFFTFGLTGFSQQSLESILKSQNKQTVAYIKVDGIQKDNQYVFLDAREPKEFNVSHIPNAINIGYDHFKSTTFKSNNLDKNAAIIVYCSIGIRSEKIGEKLKKLGYKNVQNLYGGIFEWKNHGKTLVDNNKVQTQNVHTFSKEWSFYLKSGTAVYEK